MAAPVAARRVLFPLYAFNVEVSRAPWVTAEPMIAEMRLQWWRDALEEISEGGQVRRHSVVTPLAAHLSPEDARRLDAVVGARRWDCYKDPFEDLAQQISYLRETSGTLMSVAVRLLKGDAARAEAIGFGAGVANWLRAVPALEAQKRVPMVDGTHAGVCKLAETGLQSLQSARGKFAKSALPAIWPAIGATEVLKAALTTPDRVAAGRLPEPSRFKLALAATFGRW